MAGQGITVSILAKIEGWLEQIKLIQNAMKNIKPGTEISKGLAKDLLQVETLVNNLGKNMTQRLTSDSLITHFVDRMMDVERIFDRLGSSMQTISFGDLNPEYITANFKELLSTLEQANTALGVGMQASFLGAIADSKTLLKEFERMKLDPKDMNIDLMREALTARGQSLAKEMRAALAEVDKLKSKMDDARATRDALLDRKAFIGNDPNAKALEILGGNLPTNGTILDLRLIEEKILTIRSSFMRMGFTEGDLGKILPSVDKLMLAAKWDEIPQKLALYIRDAGTKTETRLQFAQEGFNAAKTNYLQATGTLNRVSALVYGNNKATEELENIIARRVAEETRALREELNNVKALLEGRATAGIQGAGQNISLSSAQGLRDAADAAEQYRAALELVKAGEQMVGKILGVIQRWFSVYAVVRMVSNAVKKAALTIQELDSTMTEISIVTKMSLSDLWQLMPKYTKMARDYASSIKGVYEVSLIYYQLGLEMNEVMDLTESTLKMARISGLGYSEAADYMTNAVRSFKMEMSDAERVVDVYSAVAASSASNVTELATAMSKTASSAQAVGSSFENTTAMLAVMIEATRESPENIGSAMKSIISRYGELKENKTGIDGEGEEYSLNKVDKALLTVGISIHDAKGEFREFDDVIFELAEHWNEIDKNTQRYIATIMAGNRQQSRFLALVSSYDRLKEESEKATNSEDAAQLLFLKSLDSIDAKKLQLETSILSIYTNSGIENLYKGLLDFSNNVLISFDNLSSESGLGAAVTKIASVFMTLSTLVTNAFRMIKSSLALSASSMTVDYEILSAERVVAAYEEAAKIGEAKASEVVTYAEYEKAKTTIALKEAAKRELEENKRAAKNKKLRTGAGMIASTVGLTLTTVAASMDINEDRTTKAALTSLGGILSGAGTGLMIGGVPGAIMGILTALPSVIEGLGMLSESVEEKVNRLLKNITDTSNEEIKSKDELKTLTDYKNKYEELRKTLFESAEKQKEFLNLLNEIAEKYPSLIASMDAEGNAIINMADSYEILLLAKLKAYTEDFLANLAAELTALKDIDYVMTNIFNKSTYKSGTTGITGLIKTDDYEHLYEKLLTSVEALRGKTVLKAAITASGLGDEGFSKLTGGDLTRMFFKLDSNYLSNLFESKAKESYGYLLTQSYINENEVQRMSGAWRDVISGVYSNIVNMIANNKEVSFADILNLDTNKIYNEVYDSVNDTYKTLLTTYKDEYILMINDAKSNFPEGEYESIIDVNAASNYGTKLTLAKIRTKNASYILTLNASNEALTGNESTQLQLVKIRQALDKQLTAFLDESDKYYNTESYKWYDELGNLHQFKKNRDEGKLLEAFYSGSGVFNQSGKKVDINGIGIDENWYLELLDALGYLTSSLDEIYTNLGQFSKDKIRDNLKAYIPENSENFEDITKLLESNFDERYLNILDRYKGWAEEDIKDTVKSEETRSLIQEFSTLFGPEYLLGILDLYQTILKNKNLTEQLKLDQVNILTDIFNTVTSFDDNTANSILQKAQTADFTSLFGIYDFIDLILSLDTEMDDEAINDLVSRIKDFSQLINVNFITEIENYIDSLESALDGMDTDISDATKGMNVKKAHKMASNLGKHLSDFTIKDGKFYYSNVEDIIAYYDKTNADYENALLQKINDYKNMQDIFDAMGISNGTYDIDLIGESAKTALASHNILYEELKTLYNDFLNLIEATDGYTDFFEYLEGINEKEATAVKNFITLQKAISSLQSMGFNAFWEAANLSSFDNLKQAVLDAAKAQDFSALQENTELYEAIKPYIGTLLSFFKDVNSTIVNSLIDAVGSGQLATITVTEANKDYLKELLDKGLFEGKDFDAADIIGQSISILVDLTEGIEEIILEEIAKLFTTDAEKLEAYLKYHANKYKNNKFDNFNKLAQDIVSYEDFTNYLSKNIGLSATTIGNSEQLSRVAQMYGLTMNAAEDFYVSNWSQRILQLSIDLNTLLASENASILDINAARAAVETAKQGLLTAIKEAAKDLITNYTDISVELLKALADALNVDSKTLLKYYTTGIDGATKLNINEFKSYIATLAPEIQEVLMPLFTDIADDYIKNITAAVSLVSKGTTNLSDMSSFIAKAKEFGIDATGAFSFNSLIDAWTLDPTILRNYIIELAKALKEAGILVGDEFNNFIQSQTEKAAALNVDFMSFLLVENLDLNSIAYRTLLQLLTNYYALSDQSKFREKAFKNLNGYVASTNEIINTAKELRREEASLRWAELDEKDYEALAKLELSETFGKDYTTEALLEKIASLRRIDEEALMEELNSKNYNELAAIDLSNLTEELLLEETEKLIKELTELDIKTIKAGGQLAVNKAKELAEKAEKELSTEEIEQYFYSEVNRVKSYSDSLAELTTGQYVAEGDFKNILRSVGMIDSSGMVANIENMAAAYKAIYDKMGETGESTAALLNEVYAKYLTESERGDIDAISAMSDAMGMTYETLGQILGREGTKLEDWINNVANLDMYEKIGAGKVRITDFTKFAALRGWEPGSEEWTSAFKTYNDSMIEVNKKAKTSIQEEVSALESAKGGDLLNLTELYTELYKGIESHFEYINDKNYGYQVIDKNPIADLNEKLALYGADLTDGILTLNDDANLIGVALTLKAAAESAGSELTSELLDMLTDVIKAYADAIMKGIEGGMTNVEADDLKNKAASMGIVDLRFEKTAEGLQLAQESAIELYNTIKKIDALLGRVVFDKLIESLLKNNENFKSTNSVLSRIKEINKELASASGTRVKALKEELDLAQEIVGLSAGREDSSYNFMSNEIPGGQKNMLNYAKNWHLALNEIRDAYNVEGKGANGKSARGFLSYESYYNIINELNNMAGVTGHALTIGHDINNKALTLDGTLESASAAILAGVDSLGAVKSGDVMVNIGALGINLAKGGSNLENSVTEGVQAIARSEMAALDGMIAMLEIIVAMESLGDISGEDTVIDIGDITMEGGYVEEADGTRSLLGDGKLGFTERFLDARKKFIKMLDDGLHEDLKKAAQGIKYNGTTLEDMMRNWTADLWNDNAKAADLLNAFYQAGISSAWDIDDISGSLQNYINTYMKDIQEDISIDVPGARLMVKNGVVVTIVDWDDKDNKELFEEIKKRYKDDKGNPLSDDEAKSKMADEILTYMEGKGKTGELEINEILRLRRKLLHDSTSDYFIGPDGLPIRPGDEGYLEAFVKAILSDLGDFNFGKITFDNYGVGTTDVNINDHTNFKVRVTKDGKVTWTYVDGEGNEVPETSGSTQEEAFIKLYALETGRELDQNGKPVDLGDYLSWAYQLHDIIIKTKTKFTDEKTGKDLAGDSTAVKEGLLLYLDQYRDNLQEGFLKDPTTGLAKITLPNDVTVSANMSEFTIDGTDTGEVDTGKLESWIKSLLGIDESLGKTIAEGIKEALTDLPNLLAEASTAPDASAAAGWTGLFAAIAGGATIATIAVNALNKALLLLNTLNGGKPNAPTGNTPQDNSGMGQEGQLTIPERIQGAGKESIGTAVETLPSEIETTTINANVEADTTNAETAIEGLNSDITVNVTLNPIDTAITTLLSLGYLTNVKLNPVGGGEGGNSPARGTIGLAHSKGTLMGELGPELVVSKGRYFVVGLSGPEMVDLADDAIVFNHILTRSLLEKGTSSTRGHAITNEYTAASYAKGNIHGGPAMSSASAALAALKQLRAQWLALANLSAQDLAGAGGGGGGGGGNKDAAFVKELERWYNLLQEIATLEAKITRESALQAKIKSTQYKNGKLYFNSQARTLKDLEAEIAAQTKLNTQQLIYFNKRREELNNSSPFSSLYTFDENGQLKYKEGAFEKLSKIMGRDENGQPNMSVEEQYKAILKLNPKFKEYMKYDSSGKKIEYENGKPKDEAAYQAAIQAFWDKIEADKQEMQSLHDSINETGDKILELQQQQNEILQEMKDNQMAVENAVLDAITDAAQREIDELLDTRDAIDESNLNFIDGLQDALNKEREMYQNQENLDDLNSKLRQLAILLASGGPASEISSLLKDINSAQRDMYFDLQLQQIDAIQEAADRLIEKLDLQIELMQDTLDYEKAHGLLWAQVADIMKLSPEEIAAFIHANNSEYWDDSPVASAQALQETLFQAQLWESYRDMEDEDLKAIIEALGGETEDAESQWNKFDEAMKEKYGDAWTNSANREKYKETFLNKYNETGNYTDASNAVLDSSEFTDENMVTDDDKKEKMWLVKQSKSGQWNVKKGNAKSKHKHTYETALKRVDANNKIWEAAGKPKKGKAGKNGKKPKYKYKYDIGGMVAEEGLGYLHAKEAVLTAAQADVLRNDLLGNNKNSLATLLTDFRNAYGNLQTGDKVTNNNNGIGIGNATVNMNVQKISNDYDAQRAGEQALNKMIEIARKTKALNRIGG